MAARVIAFINFKGGVGKTSNVVNLGAALAKHQGQRVLIVDLDAQCNATTWLLRRAFWNPAQPEHRARSVAQIFRDRAQGTHLFRPEEAIFVGVPWSEEGYSLIAGLDLLPASVDLLESEELLGDKAAQPYFTALRGGLRPLRSAYDYILLDCPPNLYAVTKNALFYADHYVVPYIPDFLSLSGLQIFAKLVGRFQEKVGGHHVGQLSSRLAGFIINRYKRQGNVYAGAMADLTVELGDLRARGAVHPRALVFPTPVRDCVGLAECSNHHLPVLLYNERAISSQDYGALAEEFTAHFESIRVDADAPTTP